MGALSRFGHGYLRAGGGHRVRVPNRYAGRRRQSAKALSNARASPRRDPCIRKTGTLKAGEAVTVCLQPGNYLLNASFELTAADSGSAAAPVIYRASEGGKARLQGGVSLDSAAFHAVTDAAVLARLGSAVREKVRVCDLLGKAWANFPEFKIAFHGPPVAPWLYVDHQPMPLARWPNATAASPGWATFSEAVDTGLPRADAADPAMRRAHPGSFLFDDPRPARWNLSEGVWLLGYWTHDWCDEVIRVASYDKEKKVIALAAPHGYGINGGTWVRPSGDSSP